ncbi:aminopeptidase [Candidatus Peregrinibacteria bacterium]|nr:aminopeptidase [Candidatus Peregrinibacteria bacterium]
MFFEQRQSNSGSASDVSQNSEIPKKNGSFLSDTDRDVVGAVSNSPPLASRFDRASLQKEKQECVPKYFQFEKLQSDLAEAKNNVLHRIEGLAGKEQSVNSQSESRYFYSLIDAIDDCANRIKNFANKPIQEVFDVAYVARDIVKIVFSEISAAQGEELLQQTRKESLKDISVFPIDQELIDGLARLLYNSGKTKSGDTVVLGGTKDNFQVVLALARLCEQNGVRYFVDIRNDPLKAELIKNASEEGLKRLSFEEDDFFARERGVTKTLSAWSNMKINIKTDEEKVRYERFLHYQSATHDRFISGEIYSVHTRIPTPEDSVVDDIAYDKYLALYFESCDQPWEKIQDAQQELVEFLKGKKEIHIESANGTNLTLNIEGFDFVNSAIDHNIPGSEIFSAPKIDSAQGTFVSNWISKYRRYAPVKDIHLAFQNGQVSEFSASEGQDTLAAILSIDDSADGGKQGGARRLGEIGFGTNPHLKNLGRNYANISLSEKIGGSAHVAIGFSYKRTEYEGKPVHLDNGNESSIHWDIVSMLNEQGSKIVVDGITLQENGQWKEVPGVSEQSVRLLNEGWGALPSAEQPEWWKKGYSQGYAIPF